MSGFLPKEPTTFINIKLTDTGRRLLSLGRLTYDKAALSDREINYGFDRQVVGGYDMCNNRVIAPKDDHPSFTNFDGSDYITLGPARVNSVKQIASAQTGNVGFFSGDTKSGFYYEQNDTITTVRITYSAASSLPNGTNVITYDSGSESNGAPLAGNLIYIPWEPIQNSANTFDNSSYSVNNTNATNNLWYRITSASTNTLYLDRPTPNFGSTTTDQTIRAYVYPYNGIEEYYGSASTVSVGVWNMNIVRTSDVIGTESTGSGYTTYGSVEYNGAKTFFGFSSETKEFGLIHFTNENTGNAYAEKFVERTVELNLPNVMWHKTNADVGKGVTMGLTIYDSAGETYIDPANNSSYRLLRDGSALSNVAVGRVYHNLKMVVITDPELLTIMSYKANRSFTLPKPQLTLTSSPKFPLTTSDATGLCSSGNTYFVTYRIESESAYTENVSFGYPQSMPCAYVEKIGGQSDANGDPSYLTINFPPTSFPFMRSSDDMDPTGSFSGTGWNANKIQIMVNEVSDSDTLDFDTIPADGWKLVSSGVGNGIYTGDTTDTTINPLKLQAHQFTISREDFASGTTFVLDSDFTSNIDVSQDGLTFGNESFFYGTLKTSIAATSFKTSIVVLADNTRFNSSNNPTFNKVLDESTYITEIGVFNQENELVAVGKPTFPLKKSDGKFLAFKLEYDF